MIPSNERTEAMPTLSEELGEYEDYLVSNKGSEFVGLPTTTFPRLDQATLGLRGLMLMVGGPNVGKTTLCVQLGMDIVANNPDACFLFLSLEMPRQAIMSRMLCCLSGLEWQTLIAGSKAKHGDATAAKFTADEAEALSEARAKLRDLGKRVVILDEDNFARPMVSEVVAQLKALKERSGAPRAYILVDYLQVFAIPKADRESFGITSDTEADRWRIGAMKRLRDQTGDAVMVISEARKPESGEKWARTMNDVLGSERNAYTPDIVFLLQPLTAEELVRQWGGAPEQAAREMRSLGMTFLRMAIAKGRDGVTHDTLDLTFWFRQLRFAGGFRKV